MSSKPIRPLVAALATTVLGSALVACSGGAVSPSTTTAPTAQTIATQAAPTAQALATQSAPTAQALATQVAPAAATASASAPVHILGVQSTSSDQSITLQNTSTSTVDLSGWTLQVGTASVQLPSGLNVQPGQTVTLHTMSGTSSGNEVYLGSAASAIAGQLKPGARVLLQNPAGSPATAFTVPSA